MTHMLSLLPKSRFEESGVEIPGGLAFLADYRPDAIAEAAAGTEGLFMPPSHPRLDADLLARLGSVRIIQTAGAGFDSVDHAAAAKLGLIVCNSPAQNAITVAEHVIGAVICLQRELAYADETIKSGAYAQARERILDRGACELFGATVGIVGLGGIGRALAPRLAAFGATVVASDVFWPEDFAQEHGIRRVNLDELFAVSDIVTLHCPLMDATRGLVDAARLASMKPGAILVNEYMQTSDPDIYAGGDCVAIPNLITGKPFVLALGSLANRQGRVIGTNAASDDGKAAAFHGAVGTWCVKIFKMSACGTGLTIERAKAFGFDAISASLEQLDRAHFYPEKHMMTLELVVERGTRRVLGIQGVCEDGDALKARIDAVATMLQFGKPTIDDLANAEIAYAPPFASAMDAVNAVANVADNILSGQLKPISSKEFGELWKDRANNNVFFADARPAVAGNATAAKYPGEWHAIALEDIEAKFDSIPKDRPVALVCNTGLRSYEVMLYLHNHGVTDVVNALGGMQALIKRGDNM